jgi:hypothetical protein
VYVKLPQQEYNSILYQIHHRQCLTDVPHYLQGWFFKECKVKSGQTLILGSAAHGGVSPLNRQAMRKWREASANGDG